MKINILVLVILNLVVCTAFAGKQTSYPLVLDEVFWKSAEGAISYNGHVPDLQKDVRCQQITITFLGTYGGVDCSKLHYKCDLMNFKNVDGEFLSNIYGDVDDTGSALLGQIVLGTVDSNSRVTFSSDLDVKSLFVQDRYSFIEKTQGAKDKDYCSLKLN